MCTTFLSDESYYSHGCWKDTTDRAIDGEVGRLGGGRGTVLGCYEKAKSLGYTIFALQDGGKCYTTATAQDTYWKHGRGTGCSDVGGAWLNSVYEIVLG